MSIQFQKELHTSESETGPRETSLVPTPFNSQVIQALEQRVKKEALAMIPSLAKQMAKDSWQGDLDIFRIHQAQRVGLETLVTTAEAIASIERSTQQAISKHPQIDADIQQMSQQQIEIIKQCPRIAMIGYIRRYHRIDC